MYVGIVDELIFLFLLICVGSPLGPGVKEIWQFLSAKCGIMRDCLNYQKLLICVAYMAANMLSGPTWKYIKFAAGYTGMVLNNRIE